MRNSASRVLALALISQTLMFYGLPLPVLAALFFLVLVPVVVYARPANGWLLAGTFAIVTLALELVFHFTGFGTAMFYRPTEMLRRGSDDFGYAYRRNVDLKMHSPFGDLQATRRVGIIEPREIEFVTDGLGFRNRNGYAAQKLFLVGDSFAMGEGETQACMVTEVLKASYGLDIYNLAHSGDQPGDYFNHAELFIRQHAPHARVVIMFFEGNDFQPFGAKAYRRHPLRPYTQFFQDSNVYRVSRWLYARTFKPKNYNEALVATIRNLPIAFEQDYVANVLRERPFEESELRLGTLLDQLAGRVEHVFFAPAKYRVYAPLLDGHAGKILPDRNWEYLRRIAAERGIAATNLYEPLARAAREELEHGRFVYWRGDTHWNCAGMAAGARAMAPALHAKADKGPNK